MHIRVEGEIRFGSEDRASQDSGQGLRSVHELRIWISEGLTQRAKPLLRYADRRFPTASRRPGRVGRSSAMPAGAYASDSPRSFAAWSHCVPWRAELANTVADCFVDVKLTKPHTHLCKLSGVSFNVQIAICHIVAFADSEEPFWSGRNVLRSTLETGGP